MTTPWHPPSHSATTDLWLDCGPHGIVPLWQAGDIFVIAVAAARVPPCRAIIVMLIDGVRYERAVQLVAGMDGREAAVEGRG